MAELVERFLQHLRVEQHLQLSAVLRQAVVTGPELLFLLNYGDEERTIAAFLHAARIGLFEMSWNVLCPGCGGVLGANASLKSVRSDEYHCALCAAGYEPTLDEMVEVTFTVSPRVRRVVAHNPHELPMSELPNHKANVLMFSIEVSTPGTALMTVNSTAGLKAWINTSDLDRQVAAFPEYATDTTWHSTYNGPANSLPPIYGSALWGGVVGVGVKEHVAKDYPRDRGEKPLRQLLPAHLAHQL